MSLIFLGLEPCTSPEIYKFVNKFVKNLVPSNQFRYFPINATEIEPEDMFMSFLETESLKLIISNGCSSVSHLMVSID